MIWGYPYFRKHPYIMDIFISYSSQSNFSASWRASCVITYLTIEVPPIPKNAIIVMFCLDYLICCSLNISQLFVIGEVWMAWKFQLHVCHVDLFCIWNRPFWHHEFLRESASVLSLSCLSMLLKSCPKAPATLRKDLALGRPTHDP